MKAIFVAVAFAAVEDSRASAEAALAALEAKLAAQVAALAATHFRIKASVAERAKPIAKAIGDTPIEDGEDLFEGLGPGFEGVDEEPATQNACKDTMLATLNELPLWAADAQDHSVLGSDGQPHPGWQNLIVFGQQTADPERGPAAFLSQRVSTMILGNVIKSRDEKDTAPPHTSCDGFTNLCGTVWLGRQMALLSASLDGIGDGLETYDAMNAGYKHLKLKGWGSSASKLAFQAGAASAPKRATLVRNLDDPTNQCFKEVAAKIKQVVDQSREQLGMQSEDCFERRC